MRAIISPWLTERFLVVPDEMVCKSGHGENHDTTQCRRVVCLQQKKSLHLKQNACHSIRDLGHLTESMRCIASLLPIIGSTLGKHCYSTSVIKE